MVWLLCRVWETISHTGINGGTDVGGVVGSLKMVLKHKGF